MLNFFHWYRRWRGGIWYKVEAFDFITRVTYWDRKPPRLHPSGLDFEQPIIVDIEDYNKG